MKRGMTLLETMVATTLLTLLLGLSYDILNPALQVWKVNRAHADAEQSGTLLEYKISKELVASDESSVTIQSNPPAVSFMSFGTDTTSGGWDTSTGKPQWQKFVIYYLDTSNHILYRKEWPNSSLSVQVPMLGYTFPTTTASPMSATDLLALTSSENYTEKPAAYYVYGFSATISAPQDIKLFIQLTANDGDATQTITKQVQLQMRN